MLRKPYPRHLSNIFPFGIGNLLLPLHGADHSDRDSPNSAFNLDANSRRLTLDIGPRRLPPLSACLETTLSWQQLSKSSDAILSLSMLPKRYFLTNSVSLRIFATNSPPPKIRGREGDGSRRGRLCFYAFPLKLTQFRFRVQFLRLSWIDD
jgi:hypothetical protein